MKTKLALSPEISYNYNMCGIIGIISQRDIKLHIIEGLKRLEYRGYDSAGMAVLEKGSRQIRIFKKKGRVDDLFPILEQWKFVSSMGIGHTRWATHGEPSDINAHPHSDTRLRVAIVHNGIIENYKSLRENLISLGYTFSSRTDSEVIAHLIEHKLDKNHDPLVAFREAIRDLDGSFAIVALFADDPDNIYAVRKDSPLIVGVGNGEIFLASDIPAFLPWTNRVIYLEDYEIVRASSEAAEIFSMEGKSIKKEFVQIPWSLSQAEKGGYKHFMLKEIFEQGRVIADTINPRLDKEKERVVFEEELPIDPVEISGIHIVACGTSYHAALVGKFYIEKLARIPVNVDYGSEYRYREVLLDPFTLVIAISQSGETADTLGSVRLAKEKGVKILSICNVVGSTLTRESHTTIYTYAGPEIAVASTKAFTTQLTLLLLLAIKLGVERGILIKDEEKHLVSLLANLPLKIEELLAIEADNIRDVAYEITEAKNALYLGRGLNYPIALEGALKLKEISYIHAEGYPAGEMKHGPIALVERGMPVVFIATESTLLKKVISNIEEIKSRRGLVISLVTRGERTVSSLSDLVIQIPEVDELLSPIINIIPLQLLAYHVADYLGNDVDKPRNLAKSVTVE